MQLAPSFPPAHGTSILPTRASGSRSNTIALEVTGKLDRSDWGMTFNQLLGSGNMLVSDRVQLQLDIAAVKQLTGVRCRVERGRQVVGLSVPRLAV